MSNNSNYIQTTENVQQPKKYYSYLYEIKHLPTGLFYVGSRANQSVLKKFEDCYTDHYLGSSLKKEGPFSEKDTEINPQNYAKTILRVFYDEDVKKAWKNEHGSNGLIMTYWTMYGKDKVLNGHCVLNDGSKVFSYAGNNHTQETKQKMSDSHKGEKNGMFGKNPYANKTKEELAIIRQKQSNALKGRKGINAYANKTEEEMKLINQKKSEAAKKKYYCPYDTSIHYNCHITQYIKKNYPNEKQWSKFTKEEKQNYLVVLQDDAGLIAN